jgi:UDP-N-acetylmuramoyl-L-alanyl-D-glutamate--2,6-diaminopimelate ligase
MKEVLSNFLPVKDSGVRLDSLVDILENAHKHGAGNPIITGVATDSRRVESGVLFCAIKGEQLDGHRFIGDAVARGGNAVLLEDVSWRMGSNSPVGSVPVPFIVVPSARFSVSQLAAVLAGTPLPGASNSFSVVGVTGTNGKTTTAHLVLQLQRLVGKSAASIGTLGVRTGGVHNLEGFLTDVTTPDSLQLHALLRELRASGVQTVALEVSSHSLSQSRVSHVPFSVKIFTNLSQDHLDYHQSMEQYKEVKFQMFSLNMDAPAVICTNDAVGQEFYSRLIRMDAPVVSYGQDARAHWRLLDVQRTGSVQMLRLSVGGKPVSLETPLLGEYNALNLIAALVSCTELGLDLEELLPFCKYLSQAPGRLERFESADGLIVFVDYAHTPDAIANVLGAARKMCERELWIVIGCGGDRDRSKRPKMMRAASVLADKVVVTMDNPRTEQPEQIVQDMLSEGESPYLVEYDRARAIQYAILQAQAGDVVVVAGKGHEDYQVIGTEKKFFSDQLIVEQSLKERGCGIANF